MPLPFAPTRTFLTGRRDRSRRPTAVRARRAGSITAGLLLLACSGDHAPTGTGDRPPAARASAVRVAGLPGDTTAGLAAPSGQPLERSLVGQLVDGSGVPVAEGGVSVTLAFVPDGASAVPAPQLLGATSTITDAAGVARFAAPGLAGRAQAGRLVLRADGLTEGSLPVRLVAGPLAPAASPVMSSSDSVRVGGTVALAVTPADSAGNPLGAGQTVVLSVVGGSSQGRVSAVAYDLGVASYWATFTATAAGTAGTVRATVNGVVLPATRPLTVAAGPAVDPDTAWTFCTGTGAKCTFVGRRRVRLGGPRGPYAYQTAFNEVPCAGYGFGDADPAPGEVLHCDYGPLQTTVLPNPMPGMAGLGATAVVVPLGDPGADGPHVTGGHGVAHGNPASDDGAFRTTCNLATYGFFDPIVYPGQPNVGHLHAFFGNTAIAPSSTAGAVATQGNSTCRGGTLNRTAYWSPAVFDVRTGRIIPPSAATFYYKTGYNIDGRLTQPFPAGLRMIAGDKNNTDPSASTGAVWGCADRYIAGTLAIPTVCTTVRLTVLFPQCWDGVRLDAPDHQSHMAAARYSSDPAVRSRCPADHPVQLPQITEFFDYPVGPGDDPRFWRLTSDLYPASLPGGMSAHADWMLGWDPTILATIVRACINAGADCGVGGIGDGRELY